MGEHLITRTTDQHRRRMATDTHKLTHQHHQVPRRDDRDGHASLTNVSWSAKPVVESTPRCLESHDWQLASANTSGQFSPLSPSPAPSGDCIPERRLKDRDKTELPGIYAYCFDRGNGNYTRLIPADMLPPVLGIPAIQQGSGGMMVLPLPGAEPVGGLPSNVQPVTLKTPPPSPGPVTDTIQETIDTIVACSPAGPKRTKVYCDKWVHEGVCAFTQQGCRYKHEMPLDKATQHSLGLFHGLPTWWRKQQAELQRRQLTVSGRNVDDSVQVTSAPGSAVLGGEQQGRGAVAEADQSKVDQTATYRPQHLAAWRHRDVSKFAPVGLRDMTERGPSRAREYRMGYVTNGGPGTLSRDSGSPRAVADASSAGHITAVQQSPSQMTPCVWGPIGPPSRVPDLGHSPAPYAPFARAGVIMSDESLGNHAILRSLDGNLATRGNESSLMTDRQRLDQGKSYYEQQLVGLDCKGVYR